MPSTTSSTVSADFDSSTVMTPSLPTFSMASATRLPMVLSLLAAMEATCAISFLFFVDFDGLVDAPLEPHGVGAGGDVLQPVADDRLRQHGRRRRPVPGDVGGIAG